MDIYVTKKAGSVLFRAPRKHLITAGNQVPHEVWSQVDPLAQQELLRTGMVEEHEDPDSAAQAAARAAQEAPKAIGVREGQFLPESRVLPGKRVDAELERIAQEQEERRQAEAKAEEHRRASEVDREAGGSADGVVRVQEDEDDEDGEDDLTAEEIEAIRRMESEED